MKNSFKVKDIENRIKGMDAASALDFLYSLDAKDSAGIARLIERQLKRKAALDKEIARYNEMCLFEQEGHSKGYTLIAGVDEAGRGPLAGPVVAGAVILPHDIFIEGLNDSKQLSAAKRDQLYDIITDKAVAFGIGIVDENCIDEINILNATKIAMEKAISGLQQKPDLVLTDSVKLDGITADQINIIRGDCLSVSIAAGSIIAKVTRDRIIEEYDSIYPQYGFSRHKGYGTKEHIDAIKKYGICPIHRISFTKHFI